MQLYLPYPSIEESMMTLDPKRAGAQRSECKIILSRILADEHPELIAHWKNKKAWINHPIVHMWKSTPTGVAIAGYYACKRYQSFGYNDSLSPFFEKWANIDEINVYPPWFGNAQVHAMYRAHLLAKAPEVYYPLGWDELPRLMTAQDYWNIANGEYAVEPLNQIAQDVLALSSGTLATLLHTSDYHSIETFHAEFCEFAAEQGTQYANWQEAYYAFRNQERKVA